MVPGFFGSLKLITKILYDQDVYGYEELSMKVLIIALVIALLASLSIGQPISIGGTYGKSWLEGYGSKNIVPNSTGLWDWGHIPLGKILLKDGKLMSIGDSGDTVLIVPAFPTNTTPILQNRALMTSDYSGLSVADLSSPYLMEDPWAVSQTMGQPVLYHSINRA
jgi:hypothetical protein